MTIKENTVIEPRPSEELIAEKERVWRLKLPEDYRNFIMEFNGGEPVERVFDFGKNKNVNHVIIRFLCILDDANIGPDGWFDISVVDAQIGERLTDNEDVIGIDVLPIAELFAGDYLCLDFRKDGNAPEVCVWFHEESGDFGPALYKVAISFSEFIEMLYY